MMTIAEVAAVPVPEVVNWNIVVPTAIGIIISLGVIFAFWDRVKKCFASKAEFDSLAKELHELRLEVATLRKIDGKLDKILEVAGTRRIRHE